MTLALPTRAFVAPHATRWRRHGIALAIVAAALLALFRADAHDMAAIWWTSTTFGHCLFIAPVVGWLIWTRRRELAQLRPAAWWPGLAWVTAGGAAWLVGDAAAVALARHLGLVMMVQGAVVTLLGPNVSRGLAFPLGYALFMVPFGNGIEPPLQDVTVALTMPLLHTAGIAASVDGVLIRAGGHVFEVAEACSGAKFVLAMLAYGVLVAHLCFHGWRRRAAFMAVALVVPVLANGLRAFVTIWAATRIGVEAATGFDHIVYGWVFFALVMAGVMALGWRWFDRAPDDAAFDPASLQRPVRRRLDLAVAAALVLTVAVVSPAWSGAIASRHAPLPAHLALPAVPGWHRAPLSVRAPWQPYYPAADHFLFGRYVDARGRAVDLGVAVFADQREGRELVAFGTGVLREADPWVRVRDLPAIAGGAATEITAAGPVERVVATWYRVGTVTTADPRTVKLQTLRVRLLGGPQRAVALHLSSEGDPQAIADFARALGDIGTAADAIAGG